MDKKELAKIYTPSPRDNSLDDDEYYVLSENNTIQKGRITDIAFGLHERMKYRLFNGRGIVKCWASDELGYISKSHMYDNKKDCKNETHFAYEDWEELRN